VIAREDALLTYLADLVERMERFGIAIVAPNDDELELGREDDGCLVIDIQAIPPMARKSAAVEFDIFERWRPLGGGDYERVDYSFEIRHHELQYRRAYHRHHAEYFLRAWDIATHEHCQATMGVAACGHYYGEPVGSAWDGFWLLYDLWLSGAKPDCSVLHCLG
jgi:hypothetical protein